MTIDEIIADHETRITKLEGRAIITKKEFQEGTSKYQINFIRSDKGNSIYQGTELIVRIKGADSVSGTIKDIRGNLLQIDQSHDKDEDNDTETINFKLKHRRFRLLRFNFPKGTYVLKVKWWDKETQAQGGYEDKFLII